MQIFFPVFDLSKCLFGDKFFHDCRYIFKLKRSFFMFIAFRFKAYLLLLTGIGTVSIVKTHTFHQKKCLSFEHALRTRSLIQR